MTSVFKEKRLVAFLDILGFKKIIESNDWKEKVKTIASLIDDKIVNLKDTFHLEYILVSDTLIIYSKPIIEEFQWLNFHNLRPIFYFIRDLQSSCAQNDIWLRGGIAYDEIYVRNNEFIKNIYGPVVTKAYKLESEEAAYPRVIISDEIVKATNSSINYFISSTNDHDANPYGTLLFDSNRAKKLYLQKDACFTFVDYLDPKSASDACHLKDVIISNFKKHKFNDDISPKYKWLIDYYLTKLESSRLLQQPELKSIVEICIEELIDLRFSIET